jgi:hypothetical protein
VPQRSPSITEQLAQLYSWHQRQDDCFIPCGLVNEEQSLSSSPRVVGLLREVNSADKDWKLPLLLSNAAKRVLSGRQFSKAGVWTTWRFGGLLVQALHHGLPMSIDVASWQDAAEGLQTLGVTNLKKIPGGGTAKRNEIRAYARRDVNLWWQEIELMNPDIVLCGGTFDDVAHTIGFKHTWRWAGVRFGSLARPDSVPVFADMYHPAFRRRHVDYYQRISPGLQKLLETLT